MERNLLGGDFMLKTTEIKEKLSDLMIDDLNTPYLVGNSIILFITTKNKSIHFFVDFYLITLFYKLNFFNKIYYLNLLLFISCANISINSSCVTVVVSFSPCNR